MNVKYENRIFSYINLLSNQKLDQINIKNNFYNLSDDIITKQSKLKKMVIGNDVMHDLHNQFFKLYNQIGYQLDINNRHLFNYKLPFDYINRKVLNIVQILTLIFQSQNNDFNRCQRSMFRKAAIEIIDEMLRKLDEDAETDNELIDMYHKLKMYITLTIDQSNSDSYKYKDYPMINRTQIIDESNMPIFIKTAYPGFNTKQSLNCIFKRLESIVDDPNIDRIWITIYRISKNDSIYKKLLIKAIKNGKKVSLIIENKARGDENYNNILIQEFKDLGAEVFVFRDLKAHLKVIAWEGNICGSIISTGNWNEDTQYLYEDYILEITNPIDINMIITIMKSIFSHNEKNIPWDYLGNENILITQNNMTTYILKYIRRESKPNGRIFIKCNSFDCDEILIELILAAKKGAQVDIVCRSGFIHPKIIDDQPDNLRIHRFYHPDALEHSRVWVFGDDVYIGSLDIRKNKINARLEMMYLINDDKIKSYLISDMNALINDTSSRHTYYNYNTKEIFIMNMTNKSIDLIANESSIINSTIQPIMQHDSRNDKFYYIISNKGIQYVPMVKKDPQYKQCFRHVNDTLVINIKESSVDQFIINNADSFITKFKNAPISTYFVFINKYNNVVLAFTKTQEKLITFDQFISPAIVNIETDKEIDLNDLLSRTRLKYQSYLKNVDRSYEPVLMDIVLNNISFSNKNKLIRYENSSSSLIYYSLKDVVPNVLISTRKILPTKYLLKYYNDDQIDEALQIALPKKETKNVKQNVNELDRRKPIMKKKLTLKQVRKQQRQINANRKKHLEKLRNRRNRQIIKNKINKINSNMKKYNNLRKTNGQIIEGLFGRQQLKDFHIMFDAFNKYFDSGKLNKASQEFNKMLQLVVKYDLSYLIDDSDNPDSEEYDDKIKKYDNKIKENEDMLQLEQDFINAYDMDESGISKYAMIDEDEDDDENDDKDDDKDDENVNPILDDLKNKFNYIFELIDDENGELFSKVDIIVLRLFTNVVEDKYITFDYDINDLYIDKYISNLPFFTKKGEEAKIKKVDKIIECDTPKDVKNIAAALDVDDKKTTKIIKSTFGKNVSSGPISYIKNVIGDIFGKVKYTIQSAVEWIAEHPGITIAAGIGVTACIGGSPILSSIASKVVSTVVSVGAKVVSTVVSVGAKVVSAVIPVGAKIVSTVVSVGAKVASVIGSVVSGIGSFFSGLFG